MHIKWIKLIHNQTTEMNTCFCTDAAVETIKCGWVSRKVSLNGTNLYVSYDMDSYWTHSSEELNALLSP